MFSESPAEAWHLRYGAPPTESLDGLDRFLNHRSVRRYADREVSRGVVSGLIAAAQSAATSSNLQMWTAISVQHPARRARIAELCGGQAQVRNAPWFFAFIADLARVRRAAESVGETGAGLDYNEFFTMAVVDVALAAERMVCAAEAQGLGICYIGALRNDPYAVRELLQLPKGCFGVFGLCLGYPDEDAPAHIKPRLRQECVWHEEVYREDVPLDEYDARMKAFYESEQMKGEVTWSMRSARRVDGQHMTGREVLKAYLEEQGLDLR